MRVLYLGTALSSSDVLFPSSRMRVLLTHSTGWGEGQVPTPWDLLVGCLLSTVGAPCQGGMAKWSEQRHLIGQPDHDLSS